MHEAYWGFTEAPFALTPDPRFYYMGHAHEDSLMMLHYAIVRNKGLASITGALGMGKTAMCHKLHSLLDPAKTDVVLMVNPSMNALQFHKELVTRLGGKGETDDCHDLSRELHHHLVASYDKGNRVVLIVDDAHQMRDHGTFEELRMLLNLQMDDQFLVSIVLVGQPELSQNLAAHQELDQLVAVRERMQMLTLVETGEMVMHRLRNAGYTGEQGIFDSDALVELHRHGKGVPRMICHLADHALMLGKLEKASHVDGMLMYEAIEQFFGTQTAAA
jgi:general secretion pathway protein A